MDDIDDDIIAAAETRGKALARDPRAASARFDAGPRRVIVDLTNGCTFAFPVALVEGLSDADDRDLCEVEPLGDGYGLHWERLDVDHSVQGLLAGIFGTAAWMARRAGRATSPAKAEAARANGAKGGRPRKRA